MTSSLAVVRRPRPVTVTVGLLVFLALSAVAGGIGLIDGGISDQFPADWLDRLPLIDSWLIPGLVLGVGFGLGSFVAAYGMLTLRGGPRPAAALRWTGHHWSWSATIALGVGQVVWIALELIYLPGWSWLQVIYGGIGVALAVLPLLPAVSAHLRRP
ncbi:hypothetical protein [Dactylosporangium sp. CA-092794]|uniref:hypothetical protein n=1 Tax=Dactylosporangium sp. CA-092794 TaxID=3239929 RepID=UPI003D9080F2